MKVDPSVVRKYSATQFSWRSNTLVEYGNLLEHKWLHWERLVSEMISPWLENCSELRAWPPHYGFMDDAALDLKNLLDGAFVVAKDGLVWDGITSLIHGPVAKHFWAGRTDYTSRKYLERTYVHHAFVLRPDALEKVLGTLVTAQDVSGGYFPLNRHGDGWKRREKFALSTTAKGNILMTVGPWAAASFQVCLRAPIEYEDRIRFGMRSKWANGSTQKTDNPSWKYWQEDHLPPWPDRTSQTLK